MNYNKILKKLVDSLNGRNVFIESIKKIINTCYSVIGITKKHTKPQKLSTKEIKLEKIKNVIKERMPDLSKEDEVFLIDLFT